MAIPSKPSTATARGVPTAFDRRVAETVPTVRLDFFLNDFNV
jgi:hypothetical protein